MTGCEQMVWICCRQRDPAVTALKPAKTSRHLAAAPRLACLSEPADFKIKHDQENHLRQVQPGAADRYTHRAVICLSHTFPLWISVLGGY